MYQIPVIQLRIFVDIILVLNFCYVDWATVILIVISIYPQKLAHRKY